MRIHITTHGQDHTMVRQSDFLRHCRGKLEHTCSPPPYHLEDFVVTCQLVPSVPHLRSGSCTSPRTFGLGFLQTPPRDDALGLFLTFGSTNKYLIRGLARRKSCAMPGTHGAHEGNRQVSPQWACSDSFSTCITGCLRRNWCKSLSTTSGCSAATLTFSPGSVSWSYSST